MGADHAGQGSAALLFIHGFGGAAARWTWQQEYFQGMARVICVDLPGHGLMPWHGETLEAMAQGLSCRLRAARIEQGLAVVASSLGGLVALELWKKDPAVFRTLTLVGSIPRFTATEGFPAGLTAGKINKMSAQIDVDPGLTLDVFFRSLFTSGERASAQYELIKQMRRGTPVPSKEVLKAFLDILKITDLRDVLATAGVPVQFIFGDADPICPLSVVEPLRGIIPSARIDIMPGCGHLPFLSRPAEFNALLGDFIL